MRLMMIATVLGLAASAVAAAEPGGCAGTYLDDPARPLEHVVLEGPRLEDVPARILAGLEAPVASQSAGLDIDMLWTRFEQRNQWLVNAASDARTGVCLNGGDGGFDYFAGQVLAGPAQTLPDGFSVLELPAGRYAVFTLVGGAVDVPAAQKEIYLNRLMEAGIVARDAPDLLLFPPGFSPARRDARIELWAPIKP